MKNLERNVAQLAEESCFAAEENDKQAVYFLNNNN